MEAALHDPLSDPSEQPAPALRLVTCGCIAILLQGEFVFEPGCVEGVEHGQSDELEPSVSLPGVDLTEIYEYLEAMNESPRRQRAGSEYDQRSDRIRGPRFPR